MVSMGKRSRNPRRSRSFFAANEPLALAMRPAVILAGVCLLLAGTGSVPSPATDGSFALAFSTPGLAARVRSSGGTLELGAATETGNGERERNGEGDAHQPPTPSTGPDRRQVLSAAASACACASGMASRPGSAVAAGPRKSRTDGYAVQHTEREWAYILSGAQYNILRRGGTERQRSSILHTFTAEDQKGIYSCAGCSEDLFESSAKFNSRTGWPSFAKALDGVEAEDLDPIRATLDGREVRCGTCGGHLGDVFNDGWVYPGTMAFSTGKRYCIDGAALVFKPSGGSEADWIYGDQPPPNKVIRYEQSMYRDA
ncbi:unnamed protein product [Pseudo-nitzschia multistriata]|uniref:MsrB domain-containing protein n=1 Tax=Pseudo-nitzschia multistriata TaxID=183589 RepID=A0A448Z0B8_9STRA|nr:unnamed protein product [Pseudo-nitzschia multistriata]